MKQTAIDQVFTQLRVHQVYYHVSSQVDDKVYSVYNQVRVQVDQICRQVLDQVQEDANR